MRVHNNFKRELKKLKKLLLIGVSLLLVVGGFLFMNRGSDKEYEKNVKTKVTSYAEDKYGKENIISVKSAYDDKHRDKEKRYKIAVKVENQGLKDDEYMLYRLKNGQVIEMGITTTLPKQEK